MQRSAANRPWMPCIGNHELELGVTQYSLTGSASNENGIRSRRLRRRVRRRELSAVCQRQVRPSLLPDTVHPSRQRHRRAHQWWLQRFVLLVPSGVGTLHLTRRQRRRLPGQRGLHRDGADDTLGHHPRQHGCLQPAVHRSPRHAERRLDDSGRQQRADPVAGQHARKRGSRHHDRLDHRPDAPDCAFVLTRQRERFGHPGGVAPPVRSIPGRPRPVRARSRLRTILPRAGLQPESGNRHRRHRIRLRSGPGRPASRPCSPTPW